MPKPETSAGASSNHLLARMEQDDYNALMANATIVAFKFRKRLLPQDKPIDAVYFPLSGMVSLLFTNDGRPEVEVATIGNEGVVGASELIQSQGAMGLNLIQLPGSAIRVDAVSFRAVLEKCPAVKMLMHQHMYALMRQILYGSACSRIHGMKERCARWLLMAHDRAGVDTFPLTQQFLSHMLGVRRATVNLATGKLKKAGYIQYVRGKITIIDRAGLESTSCACYRATIQTYDSLFPKRANDSRAG